MGSWISGHESANDRLNVQLSQVRILLANTNENDGLASRVHHVERSSHLLVDRVELGHDDAIDDARVLILHCKVNQRLIEFGQLIDRVVADKGLSNEEDCVRLVDVDQLGQCSHQCLVALHSSGGVDEDHIVLVVLSFLQGFLGDHGWIVLVPFLIQRYIKARCVRLELFDGARPEVVTTCEHDPEISFRLQVVSCLGERSRFSNAIDSYKDDRIHVAFLLGGDSLLENVDVLLGGKQFLNRLC